MATASSKILKINMQTLFEVTEKDVSIGRKEVTISPSGKFLCLRNESATLVYTVDLQNTKNTKKLVCKSDLAHINSSGENVAVIQDSVAIIYKAVEPNPKKMMKHPFPEGVVFLKWIQDNVVAIVTRKSVYHWSITSAEGPKKMFDHDATLTLEYPHIMDYQTDATHNLLLLIGCRRYEFSSDCCMELYSVVDGKRRIIQGQCAAFAQLKVADSQEVSTVLCYAQRELPDCREDYTLHIEFPGNCPTLNPTELNLLDVDSVSSMRRRIHTVLPRIRMDPKYQKGDYPMEIQVGPKYDVIYVMTRMSFVYVYKMKNGHLIEEGRLSGWPYNWLNSCATAAHEPSSGMIAVNKDGDVICVKINKYNLERDEEPAGLLDQEPAQELPNKKQKTSSD